MKKYMLLFIAILILVACQKEENPKITYTGFIYKRSDSTAYANTSFIFYQYYKKSFSNDPKEKITPFTTDENGYFSTEVPLIIGYGGGLWVCWPDGVDNRTCPNQYEFNANKAYENGNNLGNIYMP